SVGLRDAVRNGCDVGTQAGLNHFLCQPLPDKVPNTALVERGSLLIHRSGEVGANLLSHRRGCVICRGEAFGEGAGGSLVDLLLDVVCGALIEGAGDVHFTTSHPSLIKRPSDLVVCPTDARAGHLLWCVGRETAHSRGYGLIREAGEGLNPVLPNLRATLESFRAGTRHQAAQADRGLNQLSAQGRKGFSCEAQSPFHLRSSFHISICTGQLVKNAGDRSGEDPANAREPARSRNGEGSCRGGE